MSFNTSKCKVLCAGRNNLNHVYTRNGIPLEVTTVERDIGVQISSNLKPFTQCTEAARRAGAIKVASAPVRNPDQSETQIIQMGGSVN